MSAGTGRPLFAVVEDEPFMAELVSDMLCSADVDVEVCTLGEDLFKSANLQNFKGILLDLSLSDMDGFDVMDRLASDTTRLLCDVPIVLMSGHDTETLRAARIYGKGADLNVRAALSKPFARDDLLAALGLSA